MSEGVGYTSIVYIASMKVIHCPRLTECPKLFHPQT
jgi:hypothetical protein